MAKKKSKAVVYMDAKQAVEVRVRDLLGRMTLEEKVRQMNFRGSLEVAKNGKFSAKLAREVLGRMSIGGLQDPRLGPRKTAELVNDIQRYLTGQTRLGIPAMITGECLHGHMSGGTTVFPQAIGLGSTWNPDLVKKVASIAAKEAWVSGVRQALSPDLDLARDPRWGRVEETYGEDAHLVGEMGKAYVRGMQGPGPGVGPEKLVVTLKHYAAHGSPQGGLNMGPVATGERELRSVYLEPFRQAVVEAGALSVMPAYSEIDGVPCSASKFLLRKILREEWGFRGYTFSDYGAIYMLHNFHRIAANVAEAGKVTLEAGMDMEAAGIWAYGEPLVKAVKKGEVSVELVEEAAANVLRVKFLAGVFENPFAEPKQAVVVVNRDEHRRQARQVAEEAVVLLKNEGGLLPLKKNIGSLAVIGPVADRAECGDYSFEKESAVSALAGIRETVGKRTKVRFEAGCGLYELSKKQFKAAVEAAGESEVAIVFVGESSMSRGGVGWEIEGVEKLNPLCGEGFDRAELNLPGVQQELVEAVAATGTPTVVVLINGRPLSVEWIAENVPAVLEAWYAGEEGGRAIADIIFGRVNPSGKLPISVPRTVGQVPNYYNHKPSVAGYYHNSGRPGKPGRDYVFTSPEPLFEFGHGLSYTKFAYSNLRVTPRRISPAGEVEVRVDVRNSGQCKGKEVVQLYVNDVVSSVTTPVKTLRGFKKIQLRPGEKKTVGFVLGRRDLALLDENMQSVVEPGKFEVMVGGLKKCFEVV